MKDTRMNSGPGELNNVAILVLEAPSTFCTQTQVLRESTRAGAGHHLSI